MATKRAAPDVADQTTVPAESPQDAEQRQRRHFGGRNWLATSIDGVLRTAEGPMSVKEIANAVTNSAGEHPSSGAVAACLQRWADAGYINVNAKPLSFKSFPAAAKHTTFEAFLAKQRDGRAKVRAEKREADALANPKPPKEPKAPKAKAVVA